MRMMRWLGRLRRSRLTPGHLHASAGHSVTGTIAGVSLPPDAAGPPVRATVRWGDGSTSVADVAGSGARRTVQATHRYRWPGLYRPRVALDDAVGGTPLATGRALVSVGRR